VPSHFVTVSDTDIENDYIQNDQQDKLIMTLLLASMHLTILTQIVGLESYAAILAKL